MIAQSVEHVNVNTAGPGHYTAHIDAHDCFTDLQVQRARQVLSDMRSLKAAQTRHHNRMRAGHWSIEASRSVGRRAHLLGQSTAHLYELLPDPARVGLLLVYLCSPSPRPIKQGRRLPLDQSTGVEGGAK